MKKNLSILFVYLFAAAAFAQFSARSLITCCAERLSRICLITISS